MSLARTADAALASEATRESDSSTPANTTDSLAVSSSSSSSASSASDSQAAKRRRVEPAAKAAKAPITLSHDLSLLSISVRPESYQTELDVKVAHVRSAFVAASLELPEHIDGALCT